jgi:hypothetical protein
MEPRRLPRQVYAHNHPTRGASGMHRDEEVQLQRGFEVGSRSLRQVVSASLARRPAGALGVPPGYPRRAAAGYLPGVGNGFPS